MVNCPCGLYSELQSLAENVNKFLQCLNKLSDKKESEIFGFGLTFEVLYQGQQSVFFTASVFGLIQTCIEWVLDQIWCDDSCVLVFPRAYYFLCEETYHRYIKTNSIPWDVSKNKRKFCK